MTEYLCLKCDYTWHETKMRCGSCKAPGQYIRDQAEHHLKNLLAVIHGDGGHYTAEHGIKKAAEDAEKVVCKDREAFDRENYRLRIMVLKERLLRTQPTSTKDPYRASGDKECSECKLCYYDHPVAPDLTPFRILCNGDRVKL